MLLARPPPHRVQQDVLHLALGLYPLDDKLVDGVAGDDVVNVDRAVVARLHLARGAHALQDLQALFQAPPVAKIDQVVAAVLQVQAVAGAAAGAGSLLLPTSVQIIAAWIGGQQ